ncbi:hypothetical protein ACLMJK_009653 [Lecanora helva]
MPKAEVGSTKYLNNKLKSKGLQRLRWYCQVCEKQNRDENGFKCHVQSESHVRKIQAIGAEGSHRAISDYSKDFQRDFIQLLRTSHNTKPVHINHFYQQYIADKQHIHMNATRWPSLTEFAKHLGREGICRVEDNEKGLHIAWVDSSPEALRRQEAIRKKERQDKGDEEREQQQIRAQIERAEMEAETKAKEDEDEEARQLKRDEGEKITLNFGKKLDENKGVSPSPAHSAAIDNTNPASQEPSKSISPPTGVPTPPPEKVSLKMGKTNNKPKNVFASLSKKNALGGKVPVKEAPKKPMSKAERIMKEEIERKRAREMNGVANGNYKRPRLT